MALLRGMDMTGERSRLKRRGKHFFRFHSYFSEKILCKRTQEIYGTGKQPLKHQEIEAISA